MRRVVAACLIVLIALPVWANARHTVLMDVLEIRQLSGILHTEGLNFGATLDREWLDGQGGAAWQQQVARIYDAERIHEAIRAGVEPALQDDLLEETITFFATDAGRRIIMLENSARAALADPDVEQAARDRFAALQGSDPRLARIERMIDAGDLINRNVTSALNSNYQFLRALVDGGVYDMTDTEILDDVMSERENIALDTEAWLGAFMLLAYSPLDADALETYVRFSESSAGTALNAGLFAGFDPLYEDISYALGRAMALNMAAEEL